MEASSLVDIKISVVLPNYNSAQYLPKAIESLVNQTEKLSEIIIVDDGSTDESLSIIHDFMKSHDHIRVIKHEKNQGVCAALNHGIEQATGDYVLLCAADDWYEWGIVAAAKQVIQKFPSVGLICGDAIVHRYDQKSFFRRSLAFSKRNTLVTAEEFKLIVRQSYVGFNTCFVNRAAILAAGMLKPELQWCCDWLLYLVTALRGGLYYCDQVFVNVLLRQDSYSEGKREGNKQKQIFLSMIHLLNTEYPELWVDFKQGALLPSYAPRYLSLFLFCPPFNRFMTKRLLWRLLINNAFITRIGRLFPYRIVSQVRKLLCA